eukprot:SAG11_NODE_1021_length_6157_cov_1.321063_1_plen_96_part_00
MMLKSVGAVMITAAFLLCAGGGAAQQLLPPLPPVTETCDVDLLSARIDAVNAACPANACDIGCATVLFPLYEDCRALLNGLYDSIDGVTDDDYRP